MTDERIEKLARALARKWNTRRDMDDLDYGYAERALAAIDAGPEAYGYQPIPVAVEPAVVARCERCGFTVRQGQTYGSTHFDVAGEPCLG